MHGGLECSLANLQSYINRAYRTFLLDIKLPTCRTTHPFFDPIPACIPTSPYSHRYPHSIPTPGNMAKKYCDHYKTHGCKEMVNADVALCENCAKGACA